MLYHSPEQALNVLRLEVSKQEKKEWVVPENTNYEMFWNLKSNTQREKESLVKLSFMEIEIEICI